MASYRTPRIPSSPGRRRALGDTAYERPECGLYLHITDHYITAYTYCNTVLRNAENLLSNLGLGLLCSARSLQDMQRRSLYARWALGTGWGTRSLGTYVMNNKSEYEA